MKFLRIASAYFEPPPQGLESWRLPIGNVEISTMAIGNAPPIEGKLRLLLKAMTDIDFPVINDEGYVVLPEDKRQELESALETAVNVLAVFSRCRRSLSAATPSVALIPESDAEREKLDASKGFLVSRTMIHGWREQIPLEPELLQGLGDRLAGVTLMAEAHSHRLESGRFREYVRLFESGFAMQFSQMSKKLHKFLHPAFEYTRAEINSWIRMRDPLTHADGKRTYIILLHGDVRRVTRRMEQAAYDVLFNKAVWHEWSQSRRELWRPSGLTTSVSADLVIRQGSEGDFRFQVFDEFGVFPRDLQCILSPPPEEWWCKFPDIRPEEALE